MIHCACDTLGLFGIYMRDRKEMTLNRMLDWTRQQEQMSRLASTTLTPLNKLTDVMTFNIQYTSIGIIATRIRQFLTDTSPLQDVLLRKAKREADKGATSDWHSTCCMFGVTGAEFIVCSENDAWHSDSMFDTRIAILEAPTQTHIQTMDRFTLLNCATASDGSNTGSGWAMTQVMTLSIDQSNGENAEHLNIIAQETLPTPKAMGTCQGSSFESELNGAIFDIRVRSQNHTIGPWVADNQSVIDLITSNLNLNNRNKLKIGRPMLVNAFLEVARIYTTTRITPPDPLIEVQLQNQKNKWPTITKKFRCASAHNVIKIKSHQTAVDPKPNWLFWCINKLVDRCRRNTHRRHSISSIHGPLLRHI